MKRITWRQKCIQGMQGKIRNAWYGVSQKLRGEGALKKGRTFGSLSLICSPCFKSREKDSLIILFYKNLSPTQTIIGWEQRNIQKIWPLNHKGHILQSQNFRNMKTPVYKFHNFNYKHWGSVIQRRHSLLTLSFANHLLLPICQTHKQSKF